MDSKVWAPRVLGESPQGDACAEPCKVTPDASFQDPALTGTPLGCGGMSGALAKCLSDPRVCTDSQKVLTDPRGHPHHLDLQQMGTGRVAALLKIAFPLPRVKEFADFIPDSCSLKG